MTKPGTKTQHQSGHIFLIGFSGSGKSTVGPILAKKLRRNFLDTDDLIEHRHGKTIADIFTTDGEPRFRQLESAILASLAHRMEPAVIALGGGAFQEPQNRRIISDSGTTIYLRSSIRELYRRLKAHSDRPLLQVTAKPGETSREARIRRIQTLLKAREESYNMADIVISTTGRTPAEVANQIIGKITKYHADRTR